MEFNEYLNLAKRTMSDKLTISVKSNTENLIIARMALGVTGEVGEISEKINKYLDSDVNFVKTRELISKEIGDTLWYLAMLCSVEYGFNLDFNTVAEEGTLKLFTRDINTISPELIIAKMALDVVREAGMIAEKVKKYMRGDMTFMEVRQTVSNDISNTLWCLITLCDSKYGFDLDFESVMNENIKKLSDRKKRGKIKGSGDER